MKEIESLAILLDNLTVNAEARMTYDMFAGGLVWSDEIPAWDFDGLQEGVFPVGHGEFRALLRYRSSLILGQPDQRFRQLWETACRLCPNWPGFLPVRRNLDLADELKRRSEISHRSFEELDARIEQNRLTSGKKAIA